MSCGCQLSPHDFILSPVPAWYAKSVDIGTNFCIVIAMQLEDCIALSAVCVAVSFCMLWGLKCERLATDHTIMKNVNANIQYFAVLMTT